MATNNLFKGALVCVSLVVLAAVSWRGQEQHVEYSIPLTGSAVRTPPGNNVNVHFPGKRFPPHWGKPPVAQTRDLVVWPGGYGRGSGTVRAWIELKMAQDDFSTDAPAPPITLPPLVKAALLGNTNDRGIDAAAALFKYSGAESETRKKVLGGGYLGLGLGKTKSSSALPPAAAPSVEVAPSNGCWQNYGQACSTGELKHPYIVPGRAPAAAAVPPGGGLPAAIAVATPVHYELKLGDFDTADWKVFYTEHSAVYNPAVVSYQNQLWLVARHEGKNKTGGWVNCPDSTLTSTRSCPVHTLRMISFNVRAKLDRNFNPTSDLECLPYDMQWATAARRKQDRELGPEDPRVFAWNGEVYAVYNAPPNHSGDDSGGHRIVRSMKLQRLFPDDGKITSLDLIDGKMERYEKNWSPLAPDPTAPDSRYLFSRNVEPHEVLSCSRLDGGCAATNKTENSPFWSKFMQLWGLRGLHLGTNAVALPNGKLVALFHGLPAGNSRDYLNFVYVVEASAPHAIIGVGEEPLRLPLGTVGSTGYAFSSNLAWVDGMLVVSYGVKDRTSNFYVLDPQTLLQNIQSTASTAVAVKGSVAAGT